MKLLLISCAGVCLAACRGQAQPVRLGTTHTLEQSGALAVLDSLHPPAPLAIVVAPSGQILRSAAAGDLDVVVTHAPTLEQRILVTPGRAAVRCPFAASRFAIVGPAADEAGVRQAGTATDAFRRIADARRPFVSRGDSSGTHIKEIALWTAVRGAAPAREPWYIQSGADQATTLRLADERRAYALADLPTWARLAPGDLRVLFAADTALTNPYTLYVIGSPTPHPAADTFATWALAEWRPRLLAGALRPPDDGAAFAPLPGGCAIPAPAP